MARRRRWVILLSVVVAVGSALAFSFTQTPVYDSHTRVLLQSSSSVFSPSGSSQGDQLSVPTEIEVFSSEPVQAAVRAKVGIAPPVTVTQVGTTNVVEVTAVSVRPQQAAALANAYSNAYIDYKRRRAVDSLLAAVQAIQPRIDELSNQISGLDAKIAAAVAANPKLTGSTPFSTERDDLVRQRDLLSQTVGNLNVDASLKNGGPQVVTPAAVPTNPSSPRPVYNGLIGLGVGLIVGLALAFLFEHLDDSVKSTDDLKRASRDIPVVGIIPAVPGWKDRKEVRTVSQTAPTSSTAEAYRSLRTSIQFLGLDRPLKVLQITSASGSEGKTTTIANLAVAIAQTGQSVIVVSCDLRRPRIHLFLGLNNDIGFTTVLLGEIPLSEAIMESPDQENLFLLGSGPIPTNPSELLNSPRTNDIMNALRSRFDMVLLDSPPSLPVTDAAVLARHADGTLVVVAAGSTTKRALSRALDFLGQVDAPIVGLVLNGASTEGSYGYSYDYYAAADSKPKHVDVAPPADPAVKVEDGA